MNTQRHHISYHKMTTVREWVRGTVLIKRSVRRAREIWSSSKDFWSKICIKVIDTIVLRRTLVIFLPFNTSLMLAEQKALCQGMSSQVLTLLTGHTFPLLNLQLPFINININTTLCNENMFFRKGLMHLELRICVTQGSL